MEVPGVGAPGVTEVLGLPHVSLVCLPFGSSCVSFFIISQTLP